VINQNKMNKEVYDRTLVEDSDLIQFVGDQIGLCNISPRTVRMLEKQEKRLITLPVAKRKSPAEIQKKIHCQGIETEQQV
jgi:hypothetical protein